MKRALLVGSVAATLAVAWGTSPARAQVAIHFGALTDSAVGAVPGAEVQVAVHVSNPNYYAIQSALKLTFFYDTTKVQLLGAVPYNDTILSTGTGPGSLTITDSSGASGYDVTLYMLRLKLNVGVTDGSFLWVRGDSAPVQYYGYQQVTQNIGQVCHATTVWGDVDGSETVDSRDALIALSSAVGLPVNGFNLALADVDEDGLTTSRDALLMLSWSIGLPIYVTNRVAVADPDACPGLTAPGDSVVFQRSPTGLLALGGSAVSPAAISGATNTGSPDGQARLAADGRSVVYVCPGHGGQQICSVDTDTGGVVMLTYDTLATDASPDWSPAGDSILYLKNGQVWKMAADGSGQAFVPATGSGINGVADVKWGRDSTKLAYANGQLHVTASDGTSDVTVTTTGITSGIQSVRWSPGGDSLLFTVSGDSRLRVVPVAGGTPGIVFAPNGSLLGADWGAQGIVFTYWTSLAPGSGSPSLWVIRGVSGPVFRVTLAPTSTTDRSPAWRRSP